MSEKVLLLKGDVDPDELISSFVFAETFPILQVTMTRLPRRRAQRAEPCVAA